MIQIAGHHVMTTCTQFRDEARAHSPKPARHQNTHLSRLLSTAGTAASASSTARVLTGKPRTPRPRRRSRGRSRRTPQSPTSFWSALTCRWCAPVPLPRHWTVPAPSLLRSSAAAVTDVRGHRGPRAMARTSTRAPDPLLTGTQPSTNARASVSCSSSRSRTASRPPARPRRPVRPCGQAGVQRLAPFLQDGASRLVDPEGHEHPVDGWRESTGVAEPSIGGVSINT